MGRLILQVYFPGSDIDDYMTAYAINDNMFL